MNKKSLIKIMAAFVFSICMMVCLSSVDTQAATKKMATESNGKYLYYSVQGTIYRMDTNTGKTKQIKKIAKTNWVTDITYHNGYLYFTVDYYYYVKGTDSSIKYVCRMKTNGTGFKKLCCGYGAKIYNGKIYFIRGENSNDGYADYTKTVGISRMKTNGSGKTNLITDASYYDDLQVVNDKLYYRAVYSSGNHLYSANLSGNNRTQLSSAIISQLLSDGSNIYYATTKELHKITAKSGTDTLIANLPYRRTTYSIFGCANILEVKGGYVYYGDYSNSKRVKLVKVNISKKTKKSIKSFSSFVGDMYIGKGKYAIIRRSIYEQKYSEAIGRITTSGKNYKTLKKYFRP